MTLPIAILIAIPVLIAAIALMARLSRKSRGDDRSEDIW